MFLSYILRVQLLLAELTIYRASESVTVKALHLM